MAIDRRQKKKKKHDEKRRKVRREKLERLLRKEKIEELEHLIREAFYYNDYRSALTYAMKRLKFPPPNNSVLEIAIQCSDILNDEVALYNLLRQAWERGYLSRGKDYLLLVKIASSKGNYKLAKEILNGLATGELPLTVSLTKTQSKQVERFLNICELREKVNLSTQKISTASPYLKSKKKAIEVSKTPSSQSAQKTEGQAEKVEDSSPEIHLTPEISFKMDGNSVLQAITELRISKLTNLEMTLQAYKLSFRTSYDQLICLPTLQNVQSLWYQEETARKVMKIFRGRAILADEVGLGKTIEACLILKEYMMRGLVRSALILTPSSLVNQWQAELSEKFGLSFISSNDSLFRQDPDRFWQSAFILSSINTAKSKRHFEIVTARSYDMVIVDEAHHLKNRSTLNWKLVNAIQKTFLMLLTATPVQNNLEELYNLVTLLRPGHFKTRKAFKEEFITRGNPTDPRNREKLRQLLKEVMLRNTRSVTLLHLPPRFASTIQVSPSQQEAIFYQAISEFVAEQSKCASHEFSKQNFQRLLAAAGSSHISAIQMLEKMANQDRNGISSQAKRILEVGKTIRIAAKTKQMVELLLASSEQKIIFVNYIATLQYLQKVLEEHKIPHVIFRGSLTTAQKQNVIDKFREGCPILLSTGTGGEGHNLQFCHTMINYDLPWNPMEIEQRIGRIHRIGQEKEVQVYNFCAAGSLEDYILEILDRKINMFELVIGEIDMILGRLKGEEEFSELIFEIWIQNQNETDRRKAFNILANRLKRARTVYEKSKELDEKLFQEDFGV